MSTVDIRIKQSGLKVSYSKVPSSGYIFGQVGVKHTAVVMQEVFSPEGGLASLSQHRNI